MKRSKTLPAIILATLASVAATTEVLACIKQVTIQCQSSGQNLGNTSYPKATCSLTYPTPLITTEVWWKPDVQVDALGIYTSTKQVSILCTGACKSYNSCISNFDFWSAGTFATGPYTVTEGNATGCH